MQDLPGTQASTLGMDANLGPIHARPRAVSGSRVPVHPIALLGVSLFPVQLISIRIIHLFLGCYTFLSAV